MMAQVISRLWKADNKDLMILPGSLPLDNGDVRNEMTYLLPPGWDPVIEGDIDGDRAETTELEQKEPRLGQVNAARRVARTLVLGTAPSCVATKPGPRGLDRARVLLGCLQPGQTSALYLDALDRLADRLQYLNSTGDKKAAATRYWFDTLANLRREMEDRKRRFDAKTDVRKKIEDVVKKVFANAPLFDGVHTFTPHADVPDDSALRLVVLPPEQEYSREESRQVTDAVREYLRAHDTQPRHRANRLVFVAADAGVLSRLWDAARVAMAWDSIVADVDEGRLNIDQNQRKQAEKEAKAASDVLPRAARECFKWLLCPVQDDPKATTPTIEAHTLNTTSGTVVSELERVCRENALIIETWSPIHLRSELKSHYWKADKLTVGAKTFWEDSLRYLYLPRLKSREVLVAAIRTGAASRDFFGTAYGEADRKYEGFQFGEGDLSVDDTLLLIEPEAAKQYAFEQKKLTGVPPPEGDETRTPVTPVGDPSNPITPPPITPTKAKTFHGTAEIPAATAKMKLVKIADEIVTLLVSDPNASIRLTIEIAAEVTVHGGSR